MTFAECLKIAKGSPINARRAYVKARRWRGLEWYEQWPRGLADEVEIALQEQAR